MANPTHQNLPNSDKHEHKLASIQSNDPDTQLTQLFQHQKKSIVIGFKEVKNLSFYKDKNSHLDELFASIKYSKTKSLYNVLFTTCNKKKSFQKRITKILLDFKATSPVCSVKAHSISLVIIPIHLVRVITKS